MKKVIKTIAYIIYLSYLCINKINKRYENDNDCNNQRPYDKQDERYRPQNKQ